MSDQRIRAGFRSDRRYTRRAASLVGELLLIVFLLVIIWQAQTQVVDLKAQNSQLQHQISTNHVESAAKLDRILSDEQQIESQIEALQRQKGG